MHNNTINFFTTNLFVKYTYEKFKYELILKKEIPHTRWGEAHHLLIFHGRRVCKARKPNCQECNIAKLCDKKLDD